MYVCEWVNVRACVYTHMYACERVCMCACVCACMYVCEHVYVLSVAQESGLLATG